MQEKSHMYSVDYYSDIRHKLDGVLPIDLHLIF